LRIVIADDFGPLRKALADLIEVTEGMELAGEATNLSETVALIKREQPDLVVLNDNMPPHDSLEIIPALLAKWPEMRILMISMKLDADRAGKAIAAGVKAYVLKQELYQDFVPAALAVGRGESYVSAQVEALLSRAKRRGSGTSGRSQPPDST
jgi:DNA-binding NarL/FixJ family response regulator